LHCRITLSRYFLAFYSSLKLPVFSEKIRQANRIFSLAKLAITDIMSKSLAMRFGFVNFAFNKSKKDSRCAGKELKIILIMSRRRNTSELKAKKRGNP